MFTSLITALKNEPYTENYKNPVFKSLLYTISNNAEDTESRPQRYQYTN